MCITLISTNKNLFQMSSKETECVRIIICILLLFLMQDKFVSIVTTIEQEVSRPMGDDPTRNVSIWLESECRECEERRKNSGLMRRLNAVNWNEIAEMKKCTSVLSDNYNHQSPFPFQRIATPDLGTYHSKERTTRE